MSNDVDISARQQGWPAQQWHPIYESFKDWLNAEAPRHDEALHTRPRVPRKLFDSWRRA